MRKYLLDSNVFDRIIASGIENALVGMASKLFVTNVQYSEIKNIPDERARERDRLLQLLERLNPKKLQLESGIWVDDLYWDDEQIWRDSVGINCQHFVEGKKKKPLKDALIGEVAKINGLILVSQDDSFRKKAEEIGIETMTFEGFSRQLNRS